MVLLVDRQGRLLMQHRDSKARTAANKWTFPGGAIEPGEEPIDAARREPPRLGGLLGQVLRHAFNGEGAVIVAYFSPTFQISAGDNLR